MGRTVFGIDIDEHPMGGLIARLLTEDDIDKLDRSVAADGGDSEEGTADDRQHTTDDSHEGAEETAETHEGTDAASAASTAGIDAAADGSAGDGGETRWRGRSRHGGDDDGDGAGITDRIPGLGDAGEQKRPLVGRLRRGLLFASAGAFGVGVLAATLWRLLGRFESDEAPEQPAEQPPATEPCRTRDETGHESGQDAGPESGDPDMGALVALSVLAVIAALARKFEQERGE